MKDFLDPVLKPIAFEIRLLQARLDRSDEHFQTFERIWAEYLGGRPHQLDFTAESDGTTVITLRRKEPIPVQLSIAFGELLYELRAALDNCLYAVAVLVSGQNPPPSAARLEWPIRFTAAEWKSQAGRFRDLPGEITDALERIQPFQAQSPDWNSLSILHDLARVDRHRSMHGLGLYLSKFRAKADQEQIEVLDIGAPRIIADGGQIMRMRVGEGVELSPSNFDLEVEFDVDVTDVRESPGPSNKIGRPWGPLDARLRSLIKATRLYTNDLLGLAADLAVKDAGQARAASSHSRL
ncbi:hypothetical protein ACTXJR_16280 [Glutamicibacter ardleyensis]|uniref:hypothetical protein n=1 Tax=Glutamicibacter ardleyensis TaxID=225894 RepID=UPI003FD22B48